MMAAINSSANLAAAIFIIFFSSSVVAGGDSKQFSRDLHKKDVRLRKEKLTHLHFYFHDTVSAERNATAVRVAQAAVTNTSATGFGEVSIADDPLTVSPDPTSRIVGRAQGMYAAADLETVGLMMVLNFEFTEGKYNGSTICVLGRNAVLSAVREMAVVGGTGVFRLARGYALAKTYSINSQGDAIVEYNVYVYHYY